MKTKKFDRVVYCVLPPLLSIGPLLISAARPVPVVLFPLWMVLLGTLIVSRVVLSKCFLYRIPPVGRRAFFCMSVGFLVGAVFVLRLTETEDHFGADPEKLTVWRGVLSADSRRLDYGRTGYNIRCCEASGNGFTVSVDCSLFATVKEGSKMRKGQPVAVMGRRSGPYFRASSVVKDGDPSLFWATRAFILEKLSQTFFMEETSSGAFFEALLLGDRDDLNSVMTDVFRKSGCLHLIALSGMHLGILIGFFRLTAGRVLPERYLNAFLILLLGFYVVLTGSAPSLKRAYIMFAVSSVSRFRGVRFPLTDILCLTLVVNALLYPQEVFHPGMRLSFAAVFGIAFFSRRLQTTFCRWLPKAAAAPPAVSYAAQIGAAPFLFAMDGVNPGGILASILVSPLLVVFMYIRILSSAVALAGWNTFALTAARLSDAVFYLIVTPLVFFSEIPTLPLFPAGVFFFFPLLLIFAGERKLFSRCRLFFLREKSKIAVKGVSGD